MNKYEKEWEEIKDLGNKGLPKSILPIVDEIYWKAMAENNYEQAIKAIIFQINAIGILEDNDDAANKIFTTLKNDAEKIPQPAKSVIYSLIGQMYVAYYNQNIWAINNRTYTTIEQENIHTWDARSLAEEAIRYFELSLYDQKILQNEPIDNYGAILNNGYNPVLQPTLFDLLANRALKFYASSFNTYALPQQTFNINDTAYFSTADKFAKLNIESPDSLLTSYLSLKTYQKLLRFHLEKANFLVNGKATNNIAALVDVDLRRMAYVKENGLYGNSDRLYEEALNRLSTEYKPYNENARVLLELGGFYLQKGDEWRINKKGETKNGYLRAYNVCRILTHEYPDQLSANVDALSKNIQKKELEVVLETVQLPDKPFLALLKFRNIKTLHQTIYPLSMDQALDYNYNVGRYVNGKHYELKDFIKKLKTKPVNKQIPMPVLSDFQYYTTEIKTDPLDKGFYLILMSDTENALQTSEVYTTALLQVTSIAAQDRLINKKMAVMVTDRETGVPLSGLKITTFIDMKPQSSFISNNSGMAASDKISNNYYNQFYSITGKNDALIVFNSAYNRNVGYPKSMDHKLILTDRAIYRPGQTVYFKAIFYNDSTDGNKTLLNRKTVNVSLRDVNRQVISEQNLTTNEYGSIDGSFSIPQGLLNGNMTIECEGYGSTSIQVEEYKRPTFEVIFDPVEGNFTLNDNVRVTAKAKALAGYAVDHAKVQYRVVRQTRYRYYYWWYPPVHDDSREISSGVLTTDEKGSLAIEFNALADDVKDDDKIYSYLVTVDVTDVSGETRSASTEVQISNKPLLINTNLPEKISSDDLNSFTVETTNLNGDPTPATVQVEIISLNAPENILRKRIWNEKVDIQLFSENKFRQLFPIDEYNNELNPENYKEIKTIAEYQIKTDISNKLDLSAISENGHYKIKITATNKDGIVTENTSYTYLLDDKPSTITSMEEWLTVIKKTGEPGEEVEFWIAGGNENTQVYCELIHKDRIIDSKWIQLTTTPSKITYPVKEIYRGGFILQFSMIQNNRVYQSTQPVIVPYTNKMLDVKLATFRDKLLPGENETWTVKISNLNGENEIAEIAATLYDASLDMFRVHNWSDLNTVYKQYLNTNSYQWNQQSIGNIFSPNTNRNKILKSWQFYTYYADINLYDANYLNAFYKNSVIYGFGQMRSAVRYRKSNTADMMNDAEMDFASESELAMPAPPASLAGGVLEESPIQQIGKGNLEVDLTAVETRYNFNETAFFYPKLRTGKNGEVSIEFTIPEALTRWKLLSFAHTKDFKIGTYTNELITQKQIAVSANAPRFLRENDRIEFTAKLNNITGTVLEGQALLRLYDAVTMQPLNEVIQSEHTTRFSVNANESTGLKWILKIPEGLQAITYRITAQAGSHSDGEEKTIPVLTNSMLVTETLPFSVRAGQEKTFALNKLVNNNSKTLRNHRLTLEFTSAPAWYAVQALPYIMEYPYECSEQTFSRYYANTLATAILNKTPRIRQLFELWNKIDSETLIANLEKNEELKQVMLEETPWIVQAKNETERKKRIGLLFDLNRMNNEMNRAFKKLKNEQNSDGGFPWFSGNPSNRFITQHIIAGIGHLEKLNAMQAGNDGDVTGITKRGLMYMDRLISEDYERLRQNKHDLKKKQISSIQLHYLYARSFSKQVIDTKHEEAFSYYLSQAGEYWNSFSTYEKAMASLVLHRNNQTKKAVAIVRSLKENAQQSEELGMYWKNNVNGYFWYQAPIETQALLIEAFDEVANDRKSVEEMKIWLLRNKQTNDWNTTKATAEAIYALLLTGDNLLDESRLLEIEVGGKQLSTVTKEDIIPEPGTGYVKTSWQSDGIFPQMGNLKVKNPNRSGIAWGGMYWQYFEELDKITSSETDLKINKQLFLIKLDNRGEQLHTIDNNNLMVGDMVRVKIELNADRDYEYIHLKDMRATGFEPVSTLSGHRYQDGLHYYESIKDASVNFFISHLRKGTYVFEYDLRVSHAGDFSNGITTIQCMYAPEFSSHSEGKHIMIQ